MLRAFWKYFWSAKTAHGLHSPFVFHLYTHVISPPASSRALLPEAWHRLRADFLQNKTPLSFEEVGAGSRQLRRSAARTIAQITRTAATTPAKAQLLYRLVSFCQPLQVLELGTCVGLGTLAMAFALPPQASLFTFEGAPPLASLSEAVFEQQAPAEVAVTLVSGQIDQTLPIWASTQPHLDFAFLDANHRFEPTLRYFDTLLPLCHEDTCLVFDDIHWSAEMEAAWETICQHESVTLSLDLFNIGVVFFRRKQPKQHFVLWHKGLG